MPRASLSLYLVVAALVAAPVAADEPPPRKERNEIRRAIMSKDCSAVDHVFLRVGLTDEQVAFVEDCWSKRQREIVPSAMNRRDCDAVLALPGIYPTGSVAEKRFVYHCWVTHELRDLDSCIALIDVGDQSSLRPIVKVLRRNQPLRHSNGGLTLIDTATACLSAYQRITKISGAELRRRAAAWGGEWSRWSQH